MACQYLQADKGKYPNEKRRTFEVQTASNGEEGIHLWREWKPDVIVSDIEMPVMDGYEMVRRIRRVDGIIPILFTSGRISPKDVVKGYELGVNNYIKKPFLAEELNAHITALLRLTNGIRSCDVSSVYAIGYLYEFDAGQAILRQKNGEEKTLTERETHLMRMLCEHKGEVVKREMILSQLWNTDDDYFASRSLDVFVSRLRKLLSEDDSVQIKTVKGVGLVLKEDGKLS